MSKHNILISVVDGQGGGIGRQYIQTLRSLMPAGLPVTVRALGTNSLATSSMLKGGADDGATGENAIIVNAEKSDIIVGVVAIVIADSILGELTGAMAAAIGRSSASRILIPFDHCGTHVVTLGNGSMQSYVHQAAVLTIEQVQSLMKED